MFSIEISADRWHPADHTSIRQTQKLEQGQIVIADRKPFRVDRIFELPTDRWPDKYVEAWRQAGMPDTDTWRDRPMCIAGVWDGPKADDTRAYGVTAPADHLWKVLPEHYSVCHKCLELPPCSHVHNEAIMERASERMDREMAILPGVCHGCREPITKRQKSFTFPGPNLIRPDLGDHTAIFHTRGKCSGALHRYDKRWAKAEPDRRPLLACEGMLTHHHGGTVECDQAECTAKGELRDIVSHRMAIWHHPGDEAARAMSTADPAAPTCWCLQNVRHKEAP